MSIVHLVGVSVDELSRALKYSGLFVDTSDDGEVMVKAIPPMIMQEGMGDIWADERENLTLLDSERSK